MLRAGQAQGMADLQAHLRIRGPWPAMHQWMRRLWPRRTSAFAMGAAGTHIAIEAAECGDA